MVIYFYCHACATSFASTLTRRLCALVSARQPSGRNGEKAQSIINVIKQFIKRNIQWIVEQLLCRVIEPQLIDRKRRLW